MQNEDAALDSLERRISKLENVVYGQPGYRQPVDSSASLLETLLNVNHMISAAANQHKNIAEVYKRLDELDKDLTEDILGVPAAEMERKREMVYAQAGQYQKNIAVIEKVHQLHEALDKGNLIKSFDDLKPEIAKAVEEFTALRKRLEEADTAEQLPLAKKALFQEVLMELVSAQNAIAQLEIAQEDRKLHE